MINSTFFDTIDSESKAYWLGFYIADGGMYRSLRQINIGLSARDYEHLAKFAKEFGVTPKLVEVPDKRFGVIRHQARLTLSSKHMCTSILSKGIPQRKSTTETSEVFNHIPKHLLHHFIRGIFDGDGSISHISGTQYRASIAGEKPIIEYVRNILINVVGISIPKMRFDSGIWNIYFSGTDRINAFKTWLYKDSTIYLERKKAIFDMVPAFRGTSKYAGVHWCNTNQKWLAKITVSGKTKTLGAFREESLANEAVVASRSLSQTS